jgi:uncharacterized protein (DUF1501 family)
MPFPIHRRQFLGQAFGLTALTATVPSFLHKTGLALAGDPRQDIAPIPGLKDNHVLVMVQLAGGNDGLNTVVPYGDDRYYRARPRLGIEKAKLHRLDDHLGLHPELVEFKKLYDDGGLAVVQNVGYPNPDRSHFRSTDIWETASPSNQVWRTGWVGRYFDNNCSGAQSPALGLQVGDRPALTFAGPHLRGVTIANPSILSWPEKTPATEGMNQVNRIEAAGIDALDFLQRRANETLGLSRRLQAALGRAKPTQEYPPFAFCQAVKLVAQLIAAEFPTRVYFVSLASFDTHSNQALTQAALLQELSEGLSALYNDLKAQGHLERTLIMTFSEFGRRVAENQSGGTDHGTASVLFMLGGGIKPGVHGPYPDLQNLDEGDLIHRIDFRSVYAAVLEKWFQADAQRILEESFPPVALFGAGG